MRLRHADDAGSRERKRAADDRGDAGCAARHMLEFHVDAGSPEKSRLDGVEQWCGVVARAYADGEIQGALRPSAGRAEQQCRNDGRDEGAS